MDGAVQRVLKTVSVAGLLAAAAAGFGTQAAAQADQAAGEGHVPCYGINACKGTGDCGGAGHSCHGKNACKGQGYIDVEKETCLRIQGGRLTPDA